MIPRSVTRLMLVCLVTACGLTCEVNAAGESILDQAVSSAEVRRKLIGEYEASPQTFRDDRLLAVAISYAIGNQVLKARPVYETYLKDHPDHPRALRGLGGGYILEKRYDQAIVSLRKAWSLGDVDSLSMLANAYV